MAGSSYLPTIGQISGMERKVPEGMENLPEGAVKSHRKLSRHADTPQAHAVERKF